MWATSRHLLCAALLVAGPAFAAAPARPEETPIQPIPLAPPPDARGAELSGLAWHGDDLVLLPQFPRAALFAISRTAILAAIATEDAPPLAARPIAMDTRSLRDRLPAFQGFEALAVHEDQVFFAIETESRGTMAAWLVRGHLDADTVHLELDTLTETPLPAQVFNMAVEALTIHDGRLLVFYEANGANIGTARLHRYSLDLQGQTELPLPAIEYRLTDATATDADGRFWVSNYLWPGERGLLNPAADAFAIRHGLGATHQRLPAVERLIELRVTPAGVVPTDAPPRYLELDPEAGRNWEGLVRLADRGFLLVTDSHPKTLLVFLPHTSSDALAR